MRIGVDFDNTIVCFDTLFYAEALRKKLISNETPANKLAVREALRSRWGDLVWTELQGTIYGEKIQDAQPYEGVKAFFSAAKDKGHEVFVISHKTQTPALGPAHDLHAAARNWLQSQTFFSDLGLKEEHAFFETSIAGKIERIQKMKCEIFIDDLVEFLAHPDFPSTVDRILFSPSALQPHIPFRQATSWSQIQNWII